MRPKEISIQNIQFLFVLYDNINLLLATFSCNPIVMEKSPHSSSLLLSMAFSRSNLQKQTWFQLTDRQGRGPLSDLIMGFIQSWI